MKIPILNVRFITALLVVLCMAGIGSQLAKAQTVGPLVYVSNKSDGTITVIDSSTNTVVTTIPAICPDCGPGPSGLAVTPDGRFVYVANNGNASVSVIATSTNTVSVTISMCACNSSPVGVAITPDGTRAYITDTLRNAIEVIDINPSDETYNTVTTVITADVSGPKAIAMSPDGSAAFYVFGTNSVGRIDTNPASASYNTHTTTLTVGNGPTGIAITPNGGSIYVSNSTDNTVSVIPNTFPNFSPITTITSLANPGSIAITPDGKTAYVVNQDGSGTVAVINTANNMLGTPVSNLCSTLNQIAISSHGAQAFVADAECDTADGFSTATNTTTTSVPVGIGPFGVASSGPQTKILGPPGTTTTFFFNTDTAKFTGINNQGGEQVTVDAFVVVASTFPTGEEGLAGFSNETCVPYGDDSVGVDRCVEFQVHCQVSPSDPTPCNFIYLLATGYDLPANLSGGIGGPDFLVAHGVDCPLTSSSNVESIFLSYEATVKDPTTKGGSRGPSCFVATYTPGAPVITSGTSSRFTGWGSPVLDGALNQVKAGSARPLSFQFFNVDGTPVTNLSFCNTVSLGASNVCLDSPTVLTPWVNIASYGIACPNGAPVNPNTDLTAVAASGGSGFQNLGGGSYQLNWKTMKSWKGSCANVVATFDSTLTVVPAIIGFQFN